jgi:dimethylamine corrinoid protein
MAYSAAQQGSRQLWRVAPALRMPAACRLFHVRVGKGGAVASELTDMLVGMRETEVIAAVQVAKDAGRSPAAVIAELQEAMRIIGDKFEAGEFFLSELIMSAEIFKGALAVLGTDHGAPASETRGTVVLGTVHGDIHDIGKNIVASVVRANGFNVVDLGVDVPAEAFVAAVDEHGAQVVGLSCLLTTSFADMQKTIAALAAAGLRDRVKVMIGGGPVTPDLAAKFGADGAGTSAQDAVMLAAAFVDGAR